MRLTEKIGENAYGALVENYFIYKKLCQLEDIEDELGIDLSTLFKALKNSVFVNNNEDKVLLWLEYDDDFYFMDLYNHKIYLKDYGKTWALTKEELL